MALILPIILFGSGLAFQAPLPQVPATQTPPDTTLPVKKRGAYSELGGGDITEGGVMSLAKYEGGSLPFKPNKITTYVNEREIVLVQGKQRLAIPVKGVKEVLYGSAVHSRVEQDAGTAVPTTSTKNQSAGNLTIVGIVWTADTKSGVILRLDKGDYPNFMGALENVTGLKPINTDAKTH